MFVNHSVDTRQVWYLFGNGLIIKQVIKILILVTYFIRK